MNFNYNADMKYARLVCERMNLGLVIDSHNPQPRTDFSSIILPPLDPTWKKDSMEYRMWWFYLLHEAYHNKHMDDFELVKDKKIHMKSFLGSILNISTDFKIETVNRGVFAGRDRLIHQARYAFAAENIYRDMGDGDGSDPRRAKLAAVWAHDALCRVPWIPEYEDDDIPGLLGPEGQGWLEKILSFPGLSSAYSAQLTAQDTYDVTIMLLRAIEEDPEDPEVNEDPNKKPGEGGEGDDDGEGDGQGGQGEPGDGEEGQMSPSDGWVKFSQMYIDDHGESNSDRRHSLHIEYDVPDRGSWTPLPFHDCDLDKPFADPVNDNRLEQRMHEKFAQCNLSKKIRRELQAVTRTRFESGKRRGRLHKRSLHKTVNDDARIYKQRQVRFSPKSTAVMLLQDWSGSMGGDKYMNASASTHEMARVLNSLQVPFAIEGFSTDSRRHNKRMVFKKFSESWNGDKFIHRCVVASHHMSSNADGDYILDAGGQLMRQKSQRKILFVLSDGSPAAGDAHGNSGIDKFTAEVIKKLENMPGIEIYAIGIEDRNVSRLYRQYCTIDDSSELEAKLLNVLRSKIIAGMVQS